MPTSTPFFLPGENSRLLGTRRALTVVQILQRGTVALRVETKGVYIPGICIYSVPGTVSSQYLYYVGPRDTSITY
jgi:hypothetical protein